MKILLFTHIADIDGINNIVLAKKAFKKIDYVLCEANEIDKELINNWYKLKNYDYIFITDLCPSDEMALKINNSELVNKLKVFDHHQSALDKLTKKYPFINIKVKDKNGMCCGTSLFYKYLITNNYLKRIITLDKMVELTRKYDTWEWKKDNDVEACYLTYLFNAWGIKKYINKMLNKVDNAIFNFTNKELKTIATWLQEFNAKIKNIVDKMVYIKIDNYKAGIVTSSYQYRNDIAEYIKDNNYNIDFIVIVFNDKNSVSYRAIKENVDVNQIAQRFGGGGHEKAASSPITDAQKKDLIKYLKGE